MLVEKSDDTVIPCGAASFGVHGGRILEQGAAGAAKPLAGIYAPFMSPVRVRR